MSDEINHPDHYTSHPSGVECITITEHMSFNVGNAMKYCWRAGLKGSGNIKVDIDATNKHIGRRFVSYINEDAIKDLKKAEWYIKREIAKLSGNTHA